MAKRIAIVSMWPADDLISEPYFKAAIIENDRVAGRSWGRTPARALAAARGNGIMNAPWDRKWPVPDENKKTVSFEL